MTMRHWWVIPAAAFLFVLPALACGGESPTPVVQRGQPAAATTASQPPPAKVGDTVTHNGVALTVHAVQDPAPAGALPPDAGNRRVALDVGIRNVDGKEHPYNPLYAKLKTADDREARTAFSGPQPALQSGTLAPGDGVRGWLAFDVPQGAQLATFSYEPIDFSGTRIVVDLR
jgi:hypothetical protein